MTRTLRLVYPHQLFDAHLEATAGTRFVLVQDDLLFRQFRCHAHKLVLHHASMANFAGRLGEAGFEVDTIESGADGPTGPQLAELVRRARPTRVKVYDVVDDWLGRDLASALGDGGYRLRPGDVLESPGFLTSRADIDGWFGTRPARMHQFYVWQRRRLAVLVEGGRPVGGKWSFDPDNRKRLPRGHRPAAVELPREHDAEVLAAIDWVAEHFPDAPGDPATFTWPTTRQQTLAHLHAFLTERLALFGAYEDAISADSPHIYHSLLTPMLNIGLITPDEVLREALRAGSDQGVPLPSLEGFVRQLIGWREYMRATYQRYGRTMRVSNHLRHDRPLGPGWWTAGTGLAPVDHVLRGVLDTGYAHHIERLMVLGNAMCLLRTHPTAAYTWFMEMFVDAYDWVMVPNVYAMSQFAAGAAITTKPYVSGSNYLRRMSDLPGGSWAADWDALYWSFVHDHRDVFEANPRSRAIPRLWDRLDEATQRRHRDRAESWLR
ncbi:MAG TPA: cryptochrome/photolyase family protein [Dermatophilaceae bacterium]|nr:cryptochrome/photolyase family protein [Dermatophilaceae bacterium]